MRVTTVLLFALTVCNYSIVFISCSRQENPQSSPVRDISGLSRDHSAATFGKYHQYDSDDDDDGTSSTKAFGGGGSSGDATRTHRTSHTSSSSSLTAGSIPRSRRDLQVRSSRMKRSDWDDSVMSWMKRLDVRKLSPGGSGEKVADESHVIAAPAVGVRTIERVIPTGHANKRNFDADMAWLKRSGHLQNWDLDQFVRQPDVRSWDESDMAWMKRSREHERIVGSLGKEDPTNNNQPEAIRFGNVADDKPAVSSDDESQGDKRKWKSDVTWIKK